jgi:3,4-dihydroxy 2-butanone 4-phosphate synthase/GTP cyclohydrolase II
MARGPQLERFATEHRLDLISIADLIAYRRQREAAARSIAISRLPTDVGDFEAHVFTWGPTNVQHVALVYGEVRGEAPVLVRVHSACLTGDVFGSLRCDCDARLGAALRAVARAGRGVVVYLRDANLQLDHRVDGRDVRAAAAILSALGVRRIRLLTNNSEKCAALASTDGLDVVEGVPLPRT